MIAFLKSNDRKQQSVKPSPSTVVASEQKISTEVLPPKDQNQFIEVVSEYVRKYPSANNQLQQSALRDQRKVSISRSLKNYKISSWVGTINDLQTDTEGKAILSIRISPDIEIKTWNNSLSDIGSNTLIEKGSPVYEKLFSLSAGKKVEFSGNFIKSKLDHIKETSLTIDGSMSNPEFLFKFKSINLID